MKIFRIYLLLIAGLLLFPGCGKSGKAPAGQGLSGVVQIDGSSTVYPITEAVAEEFGAVQPRVRVTVGISGTGGGFHKFMAGETDINDASRIVKSSESGVEYIELPIAFDGLSIVVNPANSWVDFLTVEELHRLWMAGSTVKTWRDIRPAWPAETIHLYGPGTDSGTFDYFTEAINGKSRSIRADFSKSEDDNVLVQGVAGDRNALAFFGFAYYKENRDRIRVVPVDNGVGPVTPSTETINNGTYAPLSRPLFLYVSSVSAKKPEVAAFIRFYLDQAPTLVGETGYVALPASAYTAVKNRFEQGRTGSAFSGRNTIGMRIEDILAAE